MASVRDDVRPGKETAPPTVACVVTFALEARRRALELLLEHGRLPVRELASRFAMARPSV